MLYNYYASEPFRDLRKKQGYDELAPFVYKGAYKHQRLLDWPLLPRLVKFFLPRIYAEKDFSLFRPDTYETINRVSGTSFTKIAPIGFSIEERGTFIVDLMKDEDELWNGLDYSLRKQIKKGRRLGLIVRRVDNENDFKKYYELLRDSRQLMGFRTNKYGAIKQLWNYLHKEIAAPPKADRNDKRRRLLRLAEARNDDVTVIASEAKQSLSCYEVFLCYDQTGDLLAGLGLFINPDTGQCIEVGAARSEKAKNLPAGDYLKWEIIKWAKSQGLKYFDLAGVEIAAPRSAGARNDNNESVIASPEGAKQSNEEIAAPPALRGARNDSKAYNIYRYKKKWGGKFYPVYHYQSDKTHGIYRSNRSYINNLWKKLNWRYYWGDPLDVRYFLCERLLAVRNKKILDIGCGAGIILSCLNQSNDVLGIDIDSEALAIAKKINPTFNFWQLDWRKLSEDKKFNVILLIHSLELIDQSQRIAILFKIRDLLTKDGLLILTTPNRQNYYYRKKLQKLELNELNELLFLTGFKARISGWNPFPIQAGHVLKYLPGIFLLLELLMKISFRKKKAVSFYVEAARLPLTVMP